MRSSAETFRVDEKAVFRELGDDLMRPGGLELTRRGLAISGLRPGSLVLDLGCGRGVTLRYLTRSCSFRAVGVDVSCILMAEGLEKDSGLLVAVASGAHLPFAEATMDAVLAECSLSVMEKVEKVLQECSRVLKQDGLLLLHDVYMRNTHFERPLQGRRVKCCLTGAVSREKWIERLDRSGFAVAFWEDHSRELKEFAARLIFSCDSLETFRRGSRSMPEILQGREIEDAVPSAKPGYFLAVARKQ